MSLSMISSSPTTPSSTLGCTTPPSLTTSILDSLLLAQAKTIYHSRAPPLPQVEHTDVSETHSLVDVDSPHISSVPSDYESQTIKTDTQAERIEHEEEDRERQEAERKAREAKEKAREAKEHAKQEAEKASRKARENADNPVVMGNAAAVAVLGAALGFGAYRKYTAGELTWKVVGLWAGVVGLFAAGDYYVSQYFFKKYPPKK